jgi:hypothetical protein
VVLWSGQSTRLGSNVRGKLSPLWLWCLLVALGSLLVALGGLGGTRSGGEWRKTVAAYADRSPNPVGTSIRASPPHEAEAVVVIR